MIHHDSHHLYERNEGKEFFKYLVKIAAADGIVDDSEHNILHRAGRKFGLTDPEVDQLIAKPAESAYHPPVELEKKFHNLYIIVQLINADEIIHDDELKFARYFAIASGFDPNEAELIISFILKGIQEETDEDDLFKKFKKRNT